MSGWVRDESHDSQTFDLGALGELGVDNAEPNASHGGWRAWWVNCQGDTGWVRDGLYSEHDALNAAEEFMTLAVLDARRRLWNEGRLAAMHAGEKKDGR